MYDLKSALCNIDALSFRYVWPMFVSLAVLSVTLLGSGTISETPQAVIAGIDQAQEVREQKLSGYAAREHYTVRNSHFRQSAEIDAKVIFQKGMGKTYTILSRSGPGLLQERVINRILKEDASLSRSVERSHNLLTSANYSMELDGVESLHGMQCYVVNIQPRAHNFALIEGKAWFDVKGFSLLRIEGKPASSPSFWTGKPAIEREYMVVDGFTFPRHSRATTQGFFTGKSELDIEYSQYEVFR
ncbi:MAG: putative sigma regulatory protein MucB/RseB [Bryobacterales bacterium]|nr:putative sigma regulatory protein MucB/RseB [Bryobacterales bacterium]